MIPKAHISSPAHGVDKRHASTNLDDTAPAHKKICLHDPEPDPCKDAVDTPMSDDFWSAAELACDDASWDDILMSINEGNDAEIIDGMDKSITLETSPDTCFGVITLSVTSSFFREREATTAAVDMRSCGSYFKLHTLESSVYAGIVTEPTLSELLIKHSVTLSAKLIAPTSQPRKGKGKPANTEASPSKLNQGTSLRVIVYGSMREASQVGRILSGGGHYLQHPSPQDIQQFTIEVEYFNPHYLVRPGSQMPRLEDLEIDCEDSSATSILDETSKAQLMGIFDSAGDLCIKPTAKTSLRLRTRLQEHQLIALAVMSEKECSNISSRQCPSLWEADDSSCDGNTKYRHRITGEMADNPPFIAGGILADEMGLGKTLSVLSLVCWSMDLFHSQRTQADTSASFTTLVVVPKSMITGWQDQIKKHVLEGQMRVALYHGPGRQSLASHFRSYDIILTTYQTLRSDCAAKGPLFSEKWFRVVLDEAHRIGNRSTQIFHAACELQSLRRWRLTGTPIENTLDNYGALLSFLRMEPFTKKSAFDHWISNLIRDKASAGLRKLRILVQATCLRRTKRSTTQSCELPSRKIKIEKVDLHPNDRALYQFFKTEAANIAAGFSYKDSNIPSMELKGKKNIVSLINLLRQICDHGEDLLPTAAAETWKLKQSGPTSSRPGGTRGMDTAIISSASSCQPSAKIRALIRNIDAEQIKNQKGSITTPIKSVVFSYWTRMLDLIQDALQEAGYSCERIDGQRSLQQRGDSLKKFATNSSCTIMLATIGSGGEGIDLTSANHVHLIEPHWNPMAEEQAIARVHRIGQLLPVTATKYITSHSIEEYVQSIQNEKLKLIQNVWDSDGDHAGEIDSKSLEESNKHELQTMPRLTLLRV